MSYPVRPSPRGVRHDLLAGLEAMQVRVNRLLGDAFTGHRGRTPSWHPDIDIEEGEGGWLVVARLAGVAPEEVAIDIDDHDLVIRAADAGEEPAGLSPYARTLRPTAFYYRLVLPSGVDTDAIEATMDHGLLVLRMPRSTVSHSRRIPVARRITQSIERGPQPDHPD
jgi:HSP20 family protein